MARRKGINYQQYVTPLLIVLAIGVFFYGGQAGWFKSIITPGPATPPIIIPPDPTPQQQNPAYTLSLYFSPSSININQTTTGYISSNMPNSYCSVYQLDGTEWNWLTTIITENDGSYSESRTIEYPGEAYIRVVCEKGDSYKVSNTATITVTTAPVAPRPTCSSECTNAGFSGGNPSFTGFCGRTETPKTFSGGLKCCCNGLPLLPPPLCVDTDSADSNLVKGKCTDPTNTIYDTCKTPFQIDEAYCTAGKCAIKLGGCGGIEVCYDGRCWNVFNDDDGDGFNNQVEVSAGTNPGDASSHPASGEPNANQISCANSCKNINYAGSYYEPNVNCEARALEGCQLAGLPYEARTSINSSCCCYDCIGW